LLLVAALGAPCVGCASVTRGTTENISIATTPAGATAEVSGLENPTACVTPCVVQAKRNADITVTINKDGYEPQIIPLTKEIPGSGAAGFAGNILAGVVAMEMFSVVPRVTEAQPTHGATSAATKSNLTIGFSPTRPKLHATTERKQEGAHVWTSNCQTPICPAVTF
jgi:hypothetical protein